ncbi:hypothetical protein CRE_19092 [Caenorhabditis remanei]|uniref:F-box domain-containing protein n=1 Tax=Caenorhabditis remanei TaxID=31234 RepID=E3LJS5_CAERE|nr:hypothetical protein CRE_19092 [Caenorhabditis remanei]
MPARISLCEIPEVAMKEIMNKVDFRSIHSLRRVCRSIRYFIDQHKSTIEIAKLCITIHPEHVCFLYSSDGRSMETVDYWDTNFGCLVTINRKRKKIRNKNCFQTFMNDLELIIRQMSCITEELRVNVHSSSDDFFDLFKKILKSKKSQLRVNRFSIFAKDQDQIVSILSSLYPVFLKTIRICYHVGTQLETEKLETLDQWKGAEELDINDTHAITGNINNFTHFSYSKFRIQIISASDLNVLKEAFLKYASFEYCFITYKDFNNAHEIPTFFGQPHHVDPNNTTVQRWSFKYPNSCKHNLLIVEMTKQNDESKLITFNPSGNFTNCQFVVNIRPEASVPESLRRSSTFSKPIGREETKGEKARGI